MYIYIYLLQHRKLELHVQTFTEYDVDRISNPKLYTTNIYTASYLSVVLSQTSL